MIQLQNSIRHAAIATIAAPIAGLHTERRPRSAGASSRLQRRLRCAPHLHDRQSQRAEQQQLQVAASMAAGAAASGALSGFQGGAASIGVFLETAPPPLYLVYMIAAGFGLPCSEDALVVWTGAGIFTGRYGGAAGIAQVLGIIYVGVTVSDMVTFFLGAALRRGLFRSMKERLFKLELVVKTVTADALKLPNLCRDPATVERAERTVRKWSKLIGLVQRFSLGFRGPLCLVAGFTGVGAGEFAGGVAAGAFGTMALQIFAGYLLRNSPNAYLAALALVAGPNLVGHLVGPIATVLGLWAAGKDPKASDGGARASEAS